jgi:hypothetical protein
VPSFLHRGCERGPKANQAPHRAYSFQDTIMVNGLWPRPQVADFVILVKFWHDLPSNNAFEDFFDPSRDGFPPNDTIPFRFSTLQCSEEIVGKINNYLRTRSRLVVERFAIKWREGHEDGAKCVGWTQWDGEVDENDFAEVLEMLRERKCGDYLYVKVVVDERCLHEIKQDEVGDEEEKTVVKKEEENSAGPL